MFYLLFWSQYLFEQSLCLILTWNTLIRNMVEIELDPQQSVYIKRGCACVCVSVRVSPLNSSPIGLEFQGPEGREILVYIYYMNI